MLLGRVDVDLNAADEDGQTPLSAAAQSGHEGVVSILLERNDLDPDKPDKYGQTPLWRAAKNGHETILKLLRSRGSFVSRSVGGAPPTVFFPAEQSELSEPPFKRTRRL